MEMTRDALQYIADLAKSAEATEVKEICGHTYANRNLQRYDLEPKAKPIEASTLNSMVDYIREMPDERDGKTLIHIVSPSEVRLLSGLNKDRERETLFVSRAQIAEFRFDQPYDQERFLIELQANFRPTEDWKTVLQVSGNVEAKTTQNYGDSGISQKVTISQGIASKVDALVPNPVILKPYRTFVEVDQPESAFVFRIEETHGEPRFRLVEAGGGVWKNLAVETIRLYLLESIDSCCPEMASDIIIIG